MNTKENCNPTKSLLIMTMLVAPLIQAGCSGQADRSAQVGEKYGGTLNIGFDHQPTIINPILTDHSVSIGILNMVFSRLVRVSRNGELESDLAESWDISPDGLEYTFYLRQGIRFHDGVELTAEDVEYTYRMIKDPDVQSPYADSMRIVDQFIVVDPYTFRVVLKEPHVPFIYEMFRGIAPKHLYEGADIQNAEFNYKPIGTGAFKFKEWRDDDQITLEANEDYFEGRPYLDEVVFKTYGSRKQNWSALMGEEVHLVRFLRFEDFKTTKKDAAFNTYSHPGRVYYAFFYNLNDPVFADKRVREAINYCINRKAFIQHKSIGRGYGVESHGPFFPESWAFNPDVKPIAYDPYQGMRIMKELGWERDVRGAMMKDGQQFEFHVLMDGRDGEVADVAKLIYLQLSEVGIQTRVHRYNDTKIITKEYLEQNKIQAHLRVQPTGVIDPHMSMKTWHSRSRRPGKVWLDNELNPEIDRLIEMGRVTRNKNERQLIYRRLHRVIYDEHAACFLYFPYRFHGVSKEVIGADVLFKPVMSDYLVKDFYIEEKKR